MNTSFIWPDGKRAALSFSFDDARVSQVDTGLPILDEHGIKATFYVTLKFVAERLQQWKDAIRNGHEIGNHSVHHPCSGNYLWIREHALEEYSLPQMENELISANGQINEMLGVVPKTFAYPCGQKFVGRDTQVQSYVPVVAKHFIAGRSYKEEAANDPAFCDLAQLYALDADRADADSVIKVIEGALSQGGWVVLAIHDVADHARYAIEPKVLASLCRYARSMEDVLWTSRIDDIAQHIRTERVGWKSRGDG